MPRMRIRDMERDREGAHHPEPYFLLVEFSAGEEADLRRLSLELQLDPRRVMRLGLKALVAARARRPKP